LIVAYLFRVGNACLRLQVYQLVLERIGATASNTIFIDDSPRNIAAAHELGIFTVSCAEQEAGSIWIADWIADTDAAACCWMSAAKQQGQA
jgi:FMN phosphatase YigB (HAD superfamily)